MNLLPLVMKPGKTSACFRSAWFCLEWLPSKSNESDSVFRVGRRDQWYRRVLRSFPEAFLGDDELPSSTCVSVLGGFECMWGLVEPMLPVNYGEPGEGGRKNTGC